jgi:hypothetical protein
MTIQPRKGFGLAVKFYKLTPKALSALKYMEEQKVTCKHLMLMYGRCTNCGTEISSTGTLV